MVGYQEEIEVKFQNMLRGFEEDLREDDILQKDMEGFNLTISWDVCGVLGYQKFNDGEYSHGFREVLDNSDLTLEIIDPEIALKLLNGEIDNFTYTFFKRIFKLFYIDSWDEIETNEGILKTKILKLILTGRYSKGIFYHPFTLTRLPIFRDITEKWYEPHKADASYIPINTALGTFDDQVLPLKVLEYFINKSNHFLMFHTCGCRIHNDCQNHDKSIGCMYLGADTVNVKEIFPKITPERAHFGTREDALERVKLANDNGLIMVIGRLKLESEGMGVPDTGHFMTVCFCCPCCCINGKWRFGTSEFQHIIQRIEGVSVKVDEDTCVGCEECLEVCVFNGMEMIDGIARVNQEKCLGCGRCERVCPNDAITITLDDPKRLDEFIRRIEANVDVS